MSLSYCTPLRAGSALAVSVLLSVGADAQLTDVTQAPNTINAGIKKSLAQQVGAGRGDVNTPGSSVFLIARDPLRSVNRGRQIFQRKFQLSQGLGPRTNDGVGNLDTDGSLGAGISDSCAGCHSRPFGSAGFGGNVITRPDSRDAPHLFGLGLQEMLADEITSDLRDIEQSAVQQAMQFGVPITLDLESKGIAYGKITGNPDGTSDSSQVEGVNGDLRVRPFFAEGTTISMREFLVGAFNAEMGLEAWDPDLHAASAMNQDVVTPSGMLLSGSTDDIEPSIATSAGDDPDGDTHTNEIDVAIVDHMEFYLLNYFKPAIGRQTLRERRGFQAFVDIGCAECHIPDLLIEEDRRVADVETVHDPDNANNPFNQLFATAVGLFHEVDDMSGHPTLKLANRDPFLVKNIFTDFKRHDLGRDFHERNYDGSVQTEFMTEPLWGVGSTPPYGHDGRSMTLRDVILRHGGEALASRMAFEDLPDDSQDALIDFLRSLVLFSPPDTASNLDPANKSDMNYPLSGKGSIALAPLFNDPGDAE